MTKIDLMQILADKCARLTQSRVAADLGYSPSAVNQALKGSYKGDLSNLLQRVEEVYGGITVHCPVLGDIPLGQCADERKKPFAATNQQRVQLFRACKQCDIKNRDRGKP